MRAFVRCSLATLLALACSSPEPFDAGEPPVDAGASDDPCASLSCEAPPAPVCADADTLQRHAPFGECVIDDRPAGLTASCRYDSVDVACPDGCDGDRCACAAAPGPCEVEDRALGQASVHGIVVDATHAYWVDLDVAAGGRVLRQGIADGSTDVLATDQDRPSDLAVDAIYVYWTNNFGGEVMRVPKAGGPVEVFAADQGGANDVALDATHVYWTAGRNVRRRLKTGGPIEDLAAVSELAAGLALDATHVYFGALSASTDASRVLRVPTAGGALEEIATERPAPASLAVDATHLYWASLLGGHIVRWPKAGGPLDEVATELDGPAHVSLDATHIYWTDQRSDTVMRQPLRGGPAEELASGQDSARYVVASETHVYWGTHHEVRRLSRCACGL